MLTKCYVMLNARPPPLQPLLDQVRFSLLPFLGIDFISLIKYW